MADFRVVDVSLDASLAALKDSSGALHVVRVAGGVLRLNDELSGARGRQGRHWLLSRDSTRGMVVDFELVNCGQLEALARIHDGIGARLPGGLDRPLRARRHDTAGHARS